MSACIKAEAHLAPDRLWWTANAAHERFAQVAPVAEPGFVREDLQRMAALLDDLSAASSHKALVVKLQ